MNITTQEALKWKEKQYHLTAQIKFYILLAFVIKSWHNIGQKSMIYIAKHRLFPPALKDNDRAQYIQ
ncbi:MAG: hypothetical protein GX625_05200 [Clostridiaceae bacterium]|nr:hypothetical protein [Clostridiaceae bacterium]